MCQAVKGAGVYCRQVLGESRTGRGSAFGAVGLEWRERKDGRGSRGDDGPLCPLLGGGGRFPSRKDVV